MKQLLAGTVETSPSLRGHRQLRLSLATHSPIAPGSWLIPLPAEAVQAEEGQAAIQHVRLLFEATAPYGADGWEGDSETSARPQITSAIAVCVRPIEQVRASALGMASKSHPYALETAVCQRAPCCAPGMDPASPPGTSFRVRSPLPGGHPYIDGRGVSSSTQLSSLPSLVPFLLWDFLGDL